MVYVMSGFSDDAARRDILVKDGGYLGNLSKLFQKTISHDSPLIYNWICHATTCLNTHPSSYITIDHYKDIIESISEDLTVNLDVDG